jgi:hypothetical protein
VELASAADETTASCILDLYRNPYAHWHDAWGPTAAPGLVLFPTQDPFGNEAKSRQVADMLGARHTPLEDAIHWWPLQTPESASTIIAEFPVHPQLTASTPPARAHRAMFGSDTFRL